MPPLKIIESKGTESNLVGEIDFPEFYRHDRALEDIYITVVFRCSATNLDVQVNIKNSDENKKDINISKAIKYQI